jgi:hypothetical protein
MDRRLAAKFLRQPSLSSLSGHAVLGRSALRHSFSLGILHPVPEGVSFFPSMRINRRTLAEIATDTGNIPIASAPAQNWF